MSLHKSFRNDTTTPAGQVVWQWAPLSKEIDLYLEETERLASDAERTQAMRGCRCNDECVNLCEQCPNRS